MYSLTWSIKASSFPDDPSNTSGADILGVDINMVVEGVPPFFDPLIDGVGVPSRGTGAFPELAMFNLDKRSVSPFNDGVLVPDMCLLVLEGGAQSVTIRYRGIGLYGWLPLRVLNRGKCHKARLSKS